jgi:hypothetical protein
MIFPYLFGDFHPSHKQEYAGGLLLALEKPAKTAVAYAPSSAVKAGVAASPASPPTLSGVLFSRIFTSTYEIFLHI